MKSSVNRSIRIFEKTFEKKWEEVSKKAKKEIKCKKVVFDGYHYRVKFVSREGEIVISDIPREWIDEPKKQWSLIKTVENEITKRKKL